MSGRWSRFRAEEEFWGEPEALRAPTVARYIPPMRLEPGDIVRIHPESPDGHPFVRSRRGMVGQVTEQFCERTITVVAWPDGRTSTHDTHALELVEADRARTA